MSENNPVITTSAPAKIILHGEHSVVYGKMALASSIDLRTEVRVRLGRSGANVNNGKIRIDFPDLRTKYEFSLDVLEQVRSNSDQDPRIALAKILSDSHPEDTDSNEGILALLFLLVSIFAEDNIGLLPMEIKVTSKVPMGAGLGSSAAFSVALSAAFIQARQCLKKSGSTGSKVLMSTSADATSGSSSREAQQRQICDWAFQSEKILHGNPSGLDNTICTYGGMISYVHGKPMSRLPGLGSLPLRVLLINSCVSRSTRALVAKVKENRVVLLNEITNSILDALDKVTREARDTIDQIVNNNNVSSNQNGHRNGRNHVSPAESSDETLFKKLEALVDVNQGLLGSLGVSHPKLDEIISTTAKHGLHSKLTGAGGGGFAFSLISPFHKTEQIQAAKNDLEYQGFQCWDTDLAGEGVRISCTDY